MEYPPPPWELQGCAYQALCTLSVDRAERLIPRTLRVVAVLPGVTLASIWLGNYAQGSTLCYHELIVMPALVRHGAAVGAWVSHIYVDSRESLAGGREVWGLPKELARFSWTAEGAVAQTGGTALADVRPGRLFALPRVPLSLPAFGLREGQLVRFAGRGWSTPSVGRATWHAAPGSPLDALGLTGRHWTAVHRDLRLTATAPVIVAG